MPRAPLSRPNTIASSTSLGMALKGLREGNKRLEKNLLDTPEAKERRIQLYISRVWDVRQTEVTGKPCKRVGPNGRPIALFDVFREVNGVRTKTATAGEEYSEEELKVLEVSESGDELEDDEE